MAISWLAGGVAVALLAYNTVTNLVPGWDRCYVVRNVVVGAVLVLVALTAGSSLDDLGLAPDELASGWRWGRLAVLVVAVAVAAGGALAPRVRAVAALLNDRRADLSPSELAWHTMVRIPVGTAGFEELAFRGVLLGLLLEATATLTAVLVSSAVFGLWHVGPTLAAMRINDVEEGRVGAVVGAVLMTTVAGVGFAWLRLGSGSVVAPVLAHWATNAFGLLAAAVVRRTGGA